MVCWTGGADHARAAHHGELNRGAADASGGAVDEQRAAAPDAELVKRARGRLDGGRQRGSAGEVERRRDRRIVGQHRQLGLGRPLGGEAEHAIADGHVRDALAEFVDDARRLVAHRLRQLPIHQALALLPVARVDPAARTAIRTWPGPGCGSGRSTISRTSGPPNWLNLTAFIIRSDLDPLENRIRVVTCGSSGSQAARDYSLCPRAAHEFSVDPRPVEIGNGEGPPSSVSPLGDALGEPDAVGPYCRSPGTRPGGSAGALHRELASRASEANQS